MATNNGPLSGNGHLLASTDTGSARFWCSTNAATALGFSNEVFELDAGTSVDLTRGYAISALMTSTFDNFIVQVRDDNTNTVIRAYAEAAEPLVTDGFTHQDTLTFFATSDGTSGGTPKAGTYRIYVQVRSTIAAVSETYQSDSGDGGAPHAGHTISFAKGYLRGGVDFTAISISQTLGGATPSTFAWPDRVRARITSDASALTSDQAELLNCKTLSGATTTVVRTGSQAVGSTTTWDVDQSALNLDTTDTTTFGIQLDFSNSDLTTRPWTHFTGVPSGWTGGGTDGGAQTTKDIRIRKVGAFSYSSTCTLTTQSQPDADERYTRGERLPLSGNIVARLLNARSEAFAARTADEFKVKDTTSSTLEDTFTIAAHNHTTGDHDLNITALSSTMLASTNTAYPVGARTKVVRWKDTAANSPEAQTTTVGDVFSVYMVTPHLQLNNNLLDPALDVDIRQITDLGFVSVKVTGARAEAVNSAVGTLKLQDDDNLVAAIDFGSQTTATINSNAGYVPLTAWDSSLPSGLWDLFADGTGGSVAFTKTGNTGTLARKGDNSGDFTLVGLKGFELDPIGLALSGVLSQR